MSHPIATIYELFKTGDNTLQQHFEALDARAVSLKPNQAIPSGTYWFIGKTVNDYDQNTTYSKGRITINDDLSMEGEVSLEEGTNYNPSTNGKWKGKTVSGGLLQFDEEIPTHEGKFIYSGNLTSERGTISGTYYWDIRPNAKGKFNISLFQSLPDDFEGLGIRPMELCGISGYEGSISRSKFCWRWFHRQNYGDDFRVITLEEDGVTDSCTTPPHLRPRDLVGTHGYYDELDYSFFCWRWYERNGTDYKVLTIEDPPYLSPHSGSQSISPSELAGVHGYSKEAKNLKFCWRWLTTSNGHTYRAVTLE